MRRRLTDEIRDTLDLLQTLGAPDSRPIAEHYSGVNENENDEDVVDAEVKKHNYINPDSATESLGAVYGDDMDNGFIAEKDQVAFATEPETLIGVVTEIANRLDTEFQNPLRHANQQLWSVEVSVPKEAAADAERIKPGMLQDYGVEQFITAWPKDLVKYEEKPAEPPTEEEPEDVSSPVDDLQALSHGPPDESPRESIDPKLWEAAERKILGIGQ